jgi:hypothetical protein
LTATTLMTGCSLFSAMASTLTLANLLRLARRRSCGPDDHLVTVVGEHRLRHGLSKRYWIRCRVCDFEQGPYTDWQAAWLDAWRTQIETRRRSVAMPERRLQTR